MFFTVKALAIVLALATTALTVSTIVLVVQKVELQDELDAALDMLDNLSTTPTTSTTTTTSKTSTNQPGGIITTPGSGNPTGPGPGPGPGVTTPGQNPTTSTTTTIKPTTPTEALPTVNPNDIVYRLPTAVDAWKYQLHLHPNLEDRTFNGTVGISIVLQELTNVIALHSLDLDIFGISILNVLTRMRINIKDYYIDPARELLIIEMGEYLQLKSSYTLSITFRGNLTGNGGFYASSYLDENGNERWIASSKFEPTYARQAFPCFDEPAMKAIFEVILVRPTEGGYLALSNMNQLRQEEKGDITEVTFAATDNMSTYLACFIVADFGYKTAPIAPSVGFDFDLRVFATKAQVEKVSYALKVGAIIIKHYISYFNLAYPLPKLDMAAIPDFVSGAMEHWGLVTYRETALLYDDAESSSSNKQRVTSVIAHELAHMWFGDLVTMKWWNDLWLNEGFASYIEYKGMDAAEPDWQAADQFIVSDLHSVLTFDATLASHPIVQSVEKPSEITELFDSITYNKAASVIRMLEDFTSAAIFQEAVHNYLNRHQFGNAESNDFWAEFEAFDLEYDVKVIMQTWTEQTGYPVVTVTKVAPNQFKLTQKRFLSNPDDYNKQVAESPFNYRWSIPITYITSANPVTQRTWYNYNDAELTINLPSNVDWIKINKNQFGYYRVNYPDDVWRAITSALVTTPTAFSVTDRAHLLNDAFALADATQLSYKTALDLTGFLSNEVNYIPWAVASLKLRVIRNLLYYTDAFKNFKTYASGLLDKVYAHVGWDVDANNHLNNLLRVDILNTACSLGHAACLKEVGERFTEWLKDPTKKPKPDLRTVVYKYGMWSVGTEEVWDQVWDLYKNEIDANEKVKLMEGLTNIREPWILHRLIALAWDEKNVRSQDYFTCLQSISANPIGRNIVWDYVRDNWDKLLNRFGINERYLGRLIPGITKSFSTNLKLEEMQAFFEKYPEAGAGAAARKEALATVEYNINWLKANKEQIAKWLVESRREV